MNMKRVLVFLAIAVTFTAFMQAVGYVDYLVNKDFILANIEALPLRYKIALGFGEWQWWTFGISVVTGLLVAIRILFQTDRR